MGEAAAADPADDLGADGQTLQQAEATHTLTPTPDPVHAQPTQQLSRKKPQTDSHHTKYSMATSPVEALKLEELARTQIFLKVAIVTCVAASTTTT